MSTTCETYRNSLKKRCDVVDIQPVNSNSVEHNDCEKKQPIKVVYSKYSFFNKDLASRTCTPSDEYQLYSNNNIESEVSKQKASATQRGERGRSLLSRGSIEFNQSNISLNSARPLNLSRSNSRTFEYYHNMIIELRGVKIRKK